MPVSLDEMMRALPHEDRTRIERDASALAADYRRGADPLGSDAGEPSMPVAVGAKVRTGQPCPESGVWRVEDVPSATMPIAVDHVMPPYRDRAVTWELVRLAAA